MVPFDDQSPFVTSGMRVGTAAVTTRGMLEEDMIKIVGFIDEVLTNHNDEGAISSVKQKINTWMANFPLYKVSSEVS